VRPAPRGKGRRSREVKTLAIGYGEGFKFGLGEVIPTEPKAQSHGLKARQARLGSV
jgi:hypothetical protein